MRDEFIISKAIRKAQDDYNLEKNKKSSNLENMHILLMKISALRWALFNKDMMSTEEIKDKCQIDYAMIV